MTVAAPPSALSPNLSAFGARNTDLAELLLKAESAPEIEFFQTTQGVLGATHHGALLCSRHRPLDEAERLIDKIDLVSHAVVVVHGFGLGYHVQKLARRFSKAGVIVIFEPDITLLRAVFDHIDHSAWMRDALLVWITDPSDLGALAGKLDGAEAIIAQGVTILEHPPSRARLKNQLPQFSAMFGEFVEATKVTMMTTLVRATDTIRNLNLNIDHYVSGSGILDLKNVARCHPAVIVSAGPSLHKNVKQLAAENVRDHCVIIAVQTTLKPLLELGIKPHFVTALDYHEISRRFYEGLNPEDVKGVTLVVDPKAHPAILDSFPGTVRCCANGFLDKLLGPAAREMGELPHGATVAHLSVYLARYLGCNPIVLIGQDLGFSDGLYYAPQNPIHEVWAPEINPFNTLAMMEWQRIARHKSHLRKISDIHGKTIYTDAQMVTYLQQFERDFIEYEKAGIDVIDATQGGAKIDHTQIMPLAEALRRYAINPLPCFPAANDEPETDRLNKVADRLTEVRRDVAKMRELSRKTTALLDRMLADQRDQKKMERHFKKMETYRREVDLRFETFELLNHINQLGVFNRHKADRELHLSNDLDPIARQRVQLERDKANVVWIVDAAQELINQLAASERLIKGDDRRIHQIKTKQTTRATGSASRPTNRTVAALIPIDPQHNGLGIKRSLTDRINDQTILQLTLERLTQCSGLDSIILIAPRDFDVELLLDRSHLEKQIDIHKCDGSPFEPEHEAVAVARAWSDSCWRGGIAGFGAYDELLCPKIMHEIMQQRNLDAALLVGPDWPMVDPSDENGCGAVISRWREHPDDLKMVFTQAPPGLCGFLITAKLMEELTGQTRLNTIGSLLVCQPHAPQPDPIALEMNVQIEHRIRRSLSRFTGDSPRLLHRLSSLLSSTNTLENADYYELIEQYETDLKDSPDPLPRHVLLELTTDRSSQGIFRQSLGTVIDRIPMTIELAQRIFDQLAEPGDIVLTLGGFGDPLLHDSFDSIIHVAKASGIRAVHVRTELLVERSTLQRLLDSGVDVISIDLHADRAATYEAMMGFDRFKDVLLNLEWLVQHRLRLSDHSPTMALALPWIVPRLQRRSETYEDIDTFFERWQHRLGTVIIEPPPPFDSIADLESDTLIAANNPARVMRRELLRRMTIYCDGSVPASELDPESRTSIGQVQDQSIESLWRSVLNRRDELNRIHGSDHVSLRTCFP